MIFVFSRMIFLDNNATNPMAPEVINGIHRTCQEAWANPSSSYKRGQEARALIREARQCILQMLVTNDTAAATTDVNS